MDDGATIAGFLTQYKCATCTRRLSLERQRPRIWRPSLVVHPVYAVVVLVTTAATISMYILFAVGGVSRNIHFSEVDRSSERVSQKPDLCIFLFIVVVVLKASLVIVHLVDCQRVLPIEIDTDTIKG